MVKKIIPYINIGLASIMLFIAMPNLSFSGQLTGELFWIVWTVFCLLVMAANGNVILMSEEKRQRLQHIKRMRKVKREQKLMQYMNKKQEKAQERERQMG